MISCKRKCRSRNEVHLYVSEAKGFWSMYCSNVSIQPFLHMADY